LFIGLLTGGGGGYWFFFAAFTGLTTYSSFSSKMTSCTG